jgi:DUF4097 and DUF4098 domain-containing protein YvlB
MKTILTSTLFILTTLAATAQSGATPEFKSTCENEWQGNRKQHCETRDLTLPAPATGQVLTVNGGQNGGITVRGWAGSDVRVRARVQTWGSATEKLREQAKAIKINTTNNTLKAESSSGDDWSVSYEVLVPQKTALALTTHNGGIHIENVQATITFEAQNGGISLRGLGGDVRGKTQNGGVNVALTGARWEGKGLNVVTTNGGITWRIPESYSAQLTTSTVRGNLNTDFPMTVQGRIGRELNMKLGKGGAPISVVTTNGGINVKRTEN